MVRGDQRGRELGFPTANVMPSRYAAVPADGVYAAWLVRRRGEPLRTAVSIGTNPTFAGRQRRVEAYERLALDFVSRLREMRRYEEIGALVDQIAEDVDQARAALS